MSTGDLPTLNALLNGTAAILLLLGLRQIRTGRVQRHKQVMLAALAVSAAFLSSYLFYHYLHGSRRFAGPSGVRTIYLAILLSHTLLAVVNLPLIVVTVLRAFRGQFERHKRIAKITWWVWLYVSLTGVVVYLMLYRIWPVSTFEQAIAAHRGGEDGRALALYRAAEKEGHLGAVCLGAVLADRVEGSSTSSLAIARVLEKNPDEAHCLALKGRALVLADRAEIGLPILERAAKLAPDEAFILATLGFAQFRLQDYRAAAAAFERSAKLDPKMSANLYNAGYAHFLYGNYSAARPLLERAIASGLEAELAARAKEHLALIDGALWACPMHPEVTGARGDTCRICGMPLEPLSRGVPDSAPAP